MNFFLNQVEIITFLIALIASISNGKRFYITRHGPCTDCAHQDGTNYQWCHLGTASHDWDYCSTNPGHATRGQECKQGHECGFHGYNYLWCYLKDGGWDYCSLIVDTTLRQYTSKGDECHNYCDLEYGTYVCRKEDKNSEECSPVDGVAANGPGCRSLSEDGSNSCHYDSNTGYSWCYTNIRSWVSHWGYCSRSEVDSWLFSQVSRGKRAVDSSCSTSTQTMTEILVNTQSLANGARLVTAIYAEPPNRRRIRLAEGNLRGDAQTVLYEWHRDEVLNGGRTTQHSYGQIRLDIQAPVRTTNYGLFMNWQLQINGANLQFPTTVAQVIIPENLLGYEERGWRMILITGWHQSLDRGTTLWIF